MSNASFHEFKSQAIRTSDVSAKNCGCGLTSSNKLASP